MRKKNVQGQKKDEVIEEALEDGLGRTKPHTKMDCSQIEK